MSFDYKTADAILKEAASDHRSFLLEPEAYRFLEAFGIKASKKVFIRSNEGIPYDITDPFPEGKLVVKIVSPTILHKTEVRGVRFPQNDREEIKETIKAMYSEVPENFVKWVRANPKMLPESYENLNDKALEEAVKKDLRGVIIGEFVEYESGRFGHEVLIGLQNSREFGPVITYGAGGIDTEFYADIFKERKSVTTYSAEMLDDESIEKMIKIPSIYLKLSGKTRDKLKLIDDQKIIGLIQAFREIGRRYSAGGNADGFVIEELEVNPFGATNGELVAIDALCRFSQKPENRAAPKPLEKIHNLLKPKSIGIIGVSQKLNIGHIILNNIIKNGFPKDKIYVIKEGLEEIEGAKCYPSVKDMPEKVDLFIYTLPAEMVPDITKQLLEKNMAESVILISGGLGETESGKHIEETTVNMIETFRKEGKLTPIFNGGNCMGLRSLPGRYDTLFIPEYKMDLKPEGGLKNVAYLSQSGAFMICRLSKLKSINPVYSITTGNQMDISITDYLEILADDKDIKVFACYVEGFDDLDGLRFAKAAKKVINDGRYVILYKAGKTSEGKTATSGHTSSIAGDYSVCKGVLEKIGVIVPHDFDEFENITKFLSFLYGQKFQGRNIGVISNAGFECVGMADNLMGENSRLHLADLSKETVGKITKALAISKIDKIVGVKNPLDLTPMAGDEIYDLSLRAMLEDDSVDAAIVSIVPLTWAMQSLPPGEGHNEDVYSDDSIVMRLIRARTEYDKPFIAVVDCGKEYDPMVEALEDGGVPTFRTADSALRILRKFLFHATEKGKIW